MRHSEGRRRIHRRIRPRTVHHNLCWHTELRTAAVIGYRTEPPETGILFERLAGHAPKVAAAGSAEMQLGRRDRVAARNHSAKELRFSRIGRPVLLGERREPQPLQSKASSPWYGRPTPGPGTSP